MLRPAVNGTEQVPLGAGAERPRGQGDVAADCGGNEWALPVPTGLPYANGSRPVGRPGPPWRSAGQRGAHRAGAGVSLARVTPERPLG
ncbi:hypothetical protein GCM10010271_43190 [Streptomyces kurssanovii]|nr:hypothetical protein GCM10010271_43190 [Streptomyces kurssanovii]